MKLPGALASSEVKNSLHSSANTSLVISTVPFCVHARVGVVVRRLANNILHEIKRRHTLLILLNAWAQSAAETSLRVLTTVNSLCSILPSPREASNITRSINRSNQTVSKLSFYQVYLRCRAVRKLDPCISSASPVLSRRSSPTFGTTRLG